MTVSTCARMPLSAHNRQLPLVSDIHLQNTAVLKPTKSVVLPARLPSVLRESQYYDDARTDEDTSTRSCTDEAEEDEATTLMPSAFRPKTVWLDANDELDSMWTLKRANPITDENDDENDYLSQYQSPTKRSRVQTLVWEDSLDWISDTSNGLHELTRRR